MPRIFKISKQEFNGPISRRGFSLVELLIYIGLLLLVLITLVNMILGMRKAYEYLKLSRQLQTSAVTVMDRIIRDSRNASSINVAESALDVNPGVLTINTTTSTSSPQKFQYYVLNGVLRVKQDGGDVGPLTLSEVTVDNLVFRKIETGISQAVKVEMTLSSGTHTANFYDTAILRDSY